MDKRCAVIAVLAGVSVILSSVPAPCAPADARASFKDLLGIRGRLQKQLEKKLEATKPQILELRAADGADTYDLDLTVKQSDGKWVESLGWVAAWDQLTMYDWRAYFGSSRGSGFMVPRHVFPADPSGLAMKDNRLTGSMPVAFKLDQTLMEKMPPGQRYNYWDKFEARGYTRDRSQTYTFDAKVDPASVGIEMILQAAIEYPPAKDGKHGPYGPNILARFQAPGTRFTPVDVVTMGFNMGRHEGNAEGMKYENGRITGYLLVFIYSDGWYPNTAKDVPASARETFSMDDVAMNGGKKAVTGKLLGRLPPIIAKYAIDAKLENNRITGTYTAKGDMGEFSGKVTGHGGPAVVGRYKSAGGMPNQSGMLRGMVMNDLGKVESMLIPEPKLPSDEAQAMAAIAAAIGDIVVETRALHLALQAHPLPLFKALAQMDTARPQWPAGGPTPEALAEYVAAAVDTFKSALAPDAKPPVAVAESGGSSPSSGSAAMPVTGGANEFPAKAEGWWHPTAWAVIGPFEERLGFEHREAFVPDIVPTAGTPLWQSLTSAGKLADPARPPRSWTNIVSDMRAMIPPNFKSWEAYLGKGEFSRVYYGVAKVTSESARKVWLNIETYDYTKVWLNGELLWAETRLKSVRQRPMGRFVAQAKLKKGENVLLARMTMDRRSPCIAVAFTAQDPKADTPVPASKKDLLAVKTEPANPPLACDEEKGINVLWRNTEMAGTTVPVVTGDRLYATRNQDELVCLDAATGRKVWSQRVNSNNATGLTRYASAPVTDGKVTVFANGWGEVAAFDGEGKELWRKSTDVVNPQVYRYGDTIVVQGYAATNWPKIDCVSPFASDARQVAIGVVMLKAKDGSEIGRSSNNRKEEPGMFIQPRGADKVYYVANAFVILDLETGKAALSIDTFAPPGRSVCASRDTIYMTSRGFARAILVYAQPDGRLAYRETWEAGGDRKGWPVAPATVHNGQLWYWHQVVDDDKHCPDHRRILYVADAETGAPIARVKPILRDRTAACTVPVPAGDYMCMPAGRMPMITTDGNFVLVHPEMDLGAGAVQPVFVGDKLFVRSPSSMVCIAAKDKAFEAKEKAANLFRWIGPEPLRSKPVDIEPASDLVIGNDLPVGPIRQYPPEFWMGAGPFPGGGAADERLATLRPRIGTEVTLNGKTLKFASLSNRYAGNVSPTFHRQYELQGTGDSVTEFDALLDPTCCSGKDASGLFYTVLDNPVDRVVKPAYYEDQMRGITVWVGGYKIGKDEALHLAPGLYPVMIRIDPDFYDRNVRLDEMPIDVGMALASNAVENVGWPKAWRVLGPLPTDLATLGAERLAAMPGSSVTIWDDEFEVHEIPIRDGAILPLAGLMFCTKGVKYDWSKAPMDVEVMNPFVAYCYTEVDVPRDGSLYVNAGADWFMRWYVDGTAVLDTMQTGNPSGPLNVKACAFEIPLKKGKHVICVMTKPGSKGWSVSSIGAFSAKPKAELKSFELVRGKKDDFDYRFRPCFLDVPNPDVLGSLYQKRLKAAESRLKEVEKALPDSVEARTAKVLLAKIKAK